MPPSVNTVKCLAQRSRLTRCYSSCPTLGASPFPDDLDANFEGGSVPKATSVTNRETAPRLAKDHEWRPRTPVPLRIRGNRTREGKLQSHIVRDDLDATLEAHRAANRASIIRYRWAPSNDNDDLAEDGGSVPFVESDRGFPVPRGRATTTRRTASDPTKSDMTPKIMFQRSSLSATPSIERSAESSRSEDRRNWNLMMGSTVRTSDKPWASPVRSLSYISTAENRLQEEIQSFYDYVNPTTKEDLVVHRMLIDLQRATSSILPNCRLRLHGSRAARNCDSTSDVNVNLEYHAEKGSVFVDTGSFHVREELKINALMKISQAFGGSPTRFRVVKLVSDPQSLLVLTDNATGLEIRVSVGAPTMAHTEVVKSFSEESEDVLRIYHLLRAALKLKKLMGPKPTDLRSYTLMNLIMIALRHGPTERVKWDYSPELKTAPNPDSLAYKLLKVLEFIGVHIDEKRHSRVFSTSAPFEHPKFATRSQLLGLARQSDENDVHIDHLQGLSAICLKNRGIRNRKNVQQRDLRFLSIQDPARPSQDLGFRIAKIDECLSAVRYMRYMLIQAMNHWDDISAYERKISQGNLIDTFVHADWRTFSGARKRIANRFDEEDLESGQYDIHDPLRGRIVKPNASEAKAPSLSDNAAGIFGVVRKGQMSKES